MSVTLSGSIVDIFNAPLSGVVFKFVPQETKGTVLKGFSSYITIESDQYLLTIEPNTYEVYAIKPDLNQEIYLGEGTALSGSTYSIGTLLEID